jgi:hypothetical protein
MNSRLIRIALVVIGVGITIGAGYLLRTIEATASAQRASLDSLREQARALSETVAEIRAGQFAYVARGQGEAFWMSHVASLTPTLEKHAAEFVASLTTPSAQLAFEPAAAAIENVKSLDSRVKEFIKSGNALLAGDLIFSDGLESTATATEHVAKALNEELQIRLGTVSELGARHLMVFGGASAALLVLMLALALTGATTVPAVEPPVLAPVIEPVKFETPLPKARPAVTPRLVSTAQLCGELARVAEGNQLPHLLQRASKVLEASGMIVWLADPMGRQLRPAMSHGYSEPVVARMGLIAREAGNAVAAAYRSGETRTVPGDASNSGALIVPLKTANGCVGVLSAELKSGLEKDECSQALATIFAAQFATLVSVPAAQSAPTAQAAAARAAAKA